MHPDYSIVSNNTFNLILGVYYAGGLLTTLRCLITGAIAGIVLGSAVGVALGVGMLIALVYLFLGPKRVKVSTLQIPSVFVIIMVWLL